MPDLFEPFTIGNRPVPVGHNVNAPQRCPRSPRSALEKCGDDDGKEIESFHWWFKSTYTRKSKALDLSWEFFLGIFHKRFSQKIVTYLRFHQSKPAGSKSHRARSSLFLSGNALRVFDCDESQYLWRKPAP
jgi:hypothetical protein